MKNYINCFALQEKVTMLLTLGTAEILKLHTEIFMRAVIPALVNNLGLGDGRTGGFVKLSSADVTEIYKIAAKAEICEG